MLIYYAVAESEDGQRNFIRSPHSVDVGDRVSYADPMGQLYVACPVIAVRFTYVDDAADDDFGEFIEALSPICEAEEIFTCSYRKEGAEHATV